MNDFTRPLRAVDLGRMAHCQSKAFWEESGGSARVRADIEVDVRAVLVGIGQSGWRAHRIAPPGQRLLTTVHVSKFEECEILGGLTHHDDASARIRQCIAT